MGVSLSVVIPIRNDATTLRVCLQSVRASTLPPAEIIVVDDYSSDAPERVAAEFGAAVTRLARPSGPGVARNAGAAICRGDVIVFIDTDVCVRPDVLQRMQQQFDAHPDLDAVFGSYQEGAGADNFLSRYKNFQHHFVHQHSSAEAWTFWSGCGAVRRDVFLAQGGFSTSFRRPAVEDIEFGMRLFRAGGKLRLDRSIQATHLKRWSFLTVIRTDVLGRAAPWTELLLHHRSMPDDLNLRWTQRLSVALSVLSLAAVVGGSIHLGEAFAAPFAVMLLVLLAAYWAESVRIWRAAGATLTLGAGVLLVAATTSSPLIVPAIAPAYAFALMRACLPSARLRARHYADRIVALYAIAAMVLIVGQAPRHWLSVTTVGLVALIVWLNREFYAFLRARWGYSNTLAAVPFHLVYYLSGALGFVLGGIRHTISPRRFA
jgi:hypothetical protein